MFANKIAHTNSPGGQRRGLIYVSSDIGSKGIPVNSNIYFNYAGSFYPRLDITDDGEIYLSFQITPLLLKNNLTLNNDWFPVFMIDSTLSIKINGKTISISDLPLISDNDIKSNIETITYTSRDNTTIQRNYYVLYYNVTGLSVIYDSGTGEYYYDTGNQDAVQYSYLVENKTTKMYIEKKNIVEFEKEIKLYNTDITSAIDLNNTKMKNDLLTSRYCIEANTILISGIHKVKCEFTYYDSFTIDEKITNEVKCNQTFTFNQDRQVEPNLYYPYGLKNTFFDFVPSSSDLISLKINQYDTQAIDFVSCGRFTDDISILSQATNGVIYNNNTILNDGYIAFDEISGSEFTLINDGHSMHGILFSNFNYQNWFEANIGSEHEYTVTGMHLTGIWTP